MKRTKRFLSMFLGLFFIISAMSVCFSAVAVSPTTNGSTGSVKFDYDKSTQTLTVSGKGEITAGEFSDSRFADLSVKHLIIKKGITKIGDYAFSRLEIENLVIPDGVTYIGENAFSGCYKLLTVRIPKSVVKIGREAFAPVKKFVVASENQKFSSDKLGCLYNKNKTVLIRYPSKSKTAKFSVPKTVNIIRDSAFKNAESLKSVTVPNSVKSIGKSAFAFCEKITDIKLSNKIKTIKEDTFFRCERLKSITIPNSVTKISDSAFRDCIKLSEVKFSKNLKSIGSDAFSRCISLKRIKFPAKLETISVAFWDCNLESVYIPARVKHIDNRAFYCVKNIVVDKNNNYYSSDKYGCLYNKSKTKLIQYPGLNSRKSFTIPSTVKTISFCAFFQAINLETITVPKSVVKIDKTAFYWMNLKDVVYKGSKSDWKKIKIGEDNDSLYEAKITFGA